MTDEAWRGKVGRLQSDEIEAFLAEPQIARLACLDDEGWPYLVPCWHEWDGASFWVVPRKRSAWARHLQRDPRCALTVDEDGRQLDLLDDVEQRRGCRCRRVLRLGDHPAIQPAVWTRRGVVTVTAHRGCARAPSSGIIRNPDIQAHEEKPR